MLPHAPLPLWLGPTRPIEFVIEANDDRMKIGADADRSNRVEIVVLAAEVVEIILDLAGEIFDEPELDPDADRKAGAVVGEDLRCDGHSGTYRREADGAEEIVCVAHVHPGAAHLGVEQPIVRSITKPSGQSGKPLGLGGEAFLRDGCS